MTSQTAQEMLAKRPLAHNPTRW